MSNVFWVVLAVCVFDLLLVPLIIRAMVTGVWGPLMRKHPPAPLGEESVRKDFQSYRVGLMNLGYCVHTTADTHHLHLEPVRFMRWLGMKPVSIPWEAIEPLKVRGKRWAKVKVDAQTVWGPLWALQMVFPDEVAA